MLTPNSYRDEPFAWLRGGNGRRSNEPSLREINEAEMADHSEENVPLLAANGPSAAEHPNEDVMDDGGEQYEEEEEESSHRNISGTTVNCRVCDAVIQLEGRSLQHVVKCAACQEATPIRPAPAGKKYVRCPCNCLLICKASSSRIACPRQNCRRVITLGQQQSSPGTAMQAPAGTCRVTCAYCDDIFMFNTLSNQLAHCPHCRKRSAVGASYRRSRLCYSLVGLVAVLVGAIVFSSLVFGGHEHSTFAAICLYALLIGSYGAIPYFAYKVFLFAAVRCSTIVAPV